MGLQNRAYPVDSLRCLSVHHHASLCGQLCSKQDHRLTARETAAVLTGSEEPLEIARVYANAVEMIGDEESMAGRI